MQITQDVSLLLQKKYDLFLEFEHYTNLLTACDTDNMADYITKRNDLANKIDNVTEQITNLVKSVDITPSANSILSNRCRYSEVPASWQTLFLQSQQIAGVISRCIEINQQALQRMTQLSAHFKGRIADTNNTSRIIKYITSSGAIQQERSLSIKNQRI